MQEGSGGTAGADHGGRELHPPRSDSPIRRRFVQPGRDVGAARGHRPNRRRPLRHRLHEHAEPRRPRHQGHPRPVLRTAPGRCRSVAAPAHLGGSLLVRCPLGRSRRHHPDGPRRSGHRALGSEGEDLRRPALEARRRSQGRLRRLLQHGRRVAELRDRPADRRDDGDRGGRLARGQDEDRPARPARGSPPRPRGAGRRSAPTWTS